MLTVMWAGNVTIISLFVLQLLAKQPAVAGADAYWTGAAAMGLAVAGVIALPVWGRMLDRSDAARILTIATAGGACCTLFLVVLQTPLQLVLGRIVFGMAAAGMQPAIMRLIKEHAPTGMDGRAISYATSFQFLAAGLAPFTAGAIGPALGLRWYFALIVVLVTTGFVVWLRSGARR
jgi:DHA1 family multidrug resistance protein-like MFS transporter